MGLSDPRAEYLEIIASQTVKKLRGINPMGLSAPRDDSIDIIDLQTVRKNC